MVGDLLSTPHIHLELLFLFYFYFFHHCVGGSSAARAPELMVSMASRHRGGEGGGRRLSATDAEERDAFTPTFLCPETFLVLLLLLFWFFGFITPRLQRTSGEAADADPELLLRSLVGGVVPVRKSQNTLV